MKAAVIYARVSSKLQDVENSISAQVRACRDYAEKHEFSIVSIYADEAESGTSDDRPEFQKMIEDARKKNFETILVYNISRFGRNREDAIVNKNYLRKKLKIKVIFITEGLGASDDIHSSFIEGILESTAEFQSKQMGREISRGKKEIVRRGFFPGGKVPIGYKRKIVEDGRIHTKLEIDENTAPFIRQLFTMAANGERLSAITDYANATQFYPPFSSSWSIQVISQIIANRVYLGEYNFGGVICKTHTELISEEIYNKANERKRENKSRKNGSAIYPLTGILFCKLCGSKMIGSGCGYKYKSNSYYQVYRCNSYALYRKCTAKTVRADKLEEKIKKKIVELLSNHEDFYHAREISEEKNTSKINIKKLKQELQVLNQKESNIIDAIIDGFKKDLFLERLEEINKKKKEIEEKIRKIEIESEENNKTLPLEEIIEIKDLIPGMSPEELKTIFKELLKIEINLDTRRGSIYFPKFEKFGKKRVDFKL